jgi:hypothetical protein
MSLDYLFNGAPPQSVTGSVSSVSGMPDWYQEYLRGIAGQATSVAGQGYQQYDGQRLAGFNQDQQNAFDTKRQSQGAWQPWMQGGLSSLQQELPTASAYLGAGAQYGDNASGQAGQASQQANQIAGSSAAPGYAMGAGQAAMGAASGPAQNWTSNWHQYMSPYTSSVVNEIGRLGNQNLQENVLGGINDSFIGSGGFGSDRNADMIGRGIRDAQTNISGLQSQALQQGYGQAANIFNSDANRQQNQQQLQSQTALNAGTLGSGALNQYAQLGANTAIQGGQLGANTNIQAGQLSNAGAQIGAAAADQSAARYGALGQLQQNLGYQDAGALGAIGSAQQGLQQQGMDLGYQNFQDQRNWNWNTLNNLNSVLRGMQIPTSQTQVSNSPYGNVGTSPLQWANMLYGQNNANNATNGTGH